MTDVYGHNMVLSVGTKLGEMKTRKTRKRVGVLAVQHESNSFAPRLATINDFQITGISGIEEMLGTTNHEVAGFFAGLRQHGLEPVPLVACLGGAGGVLETETLRALDDLICHALRVAPTLDGVLAALHGAAVSIDEHDADGHWLELIRRHTRGVPLVCVIDAHANVSERMAASCEAMVGFRTNPHLDMYDRGLEAAGLMSMILGGMPIYQAIARPPVAINILAQNTAQEPCLSLYRTADAARRQRNIASVSVCLGFPYGDVHDMGAGVIVVSKGDATAAQTLADDLAARLLRDKESYNPPLLKPERSVELALQSAPPVCLLDTGDNIGAGAPGDGVAIGHLVQQLGGPSTFLAVWDRESVKRALAVEIGSRTRLSIGGKVNRLQGPPLEVEAEVIGRHPGPFIDPAVRHGGLTEYDMGETALVRTEAGLTVQLTSRRVEPFSLQQLITCGLRPDDFHILVAKGVHAPLPAYAPVCRTILCAATPGCSTPDLLTLPYRQRRRPLYPFEELGLAAE